MSTSWLYVLADIIGWTYFFCWSLSFYPQALLNYRRKRVDGATNQDVFGTIANFSRAGLSLDFVTLNSLAFACYSIYNLNFFWNDRIREEYRQRHDGKNNSVMLNDVAFAVHVSYGRKLVGPSTQHSCRSRHLRYQLSPWHKPGGILVLNGKACQRTTGLSLPYSLFWRHWMVYPSSSERNQGSTSCITSRILSCEQCFFPGA